MPKAVNEEMVEQVLALRAIGWTADRISKHLHIAPKTVYNYAQRGKLAAHSTEGLEEYRSQRRRQFVDKAWKRIESLDLIVEEFTQGGKKEFSSAKEAATVLGIYTDKVIALEARRSSDTKPLVKIDIHPPEGYICESRVVNDPVPLCDIEDAVYSDDCGGGSGQDLLRLPEGGDNGS